MTKVRHVLGISGGKDSAALAIYLKQRHPDLDMEYYFCDTGKELDETYQVISGLENYLGKTIQRLNGAEGSSEDAFDHFLKMLNGYLPSSSIRWCTKKLKLDPFEEYVGDDPVVSYVGIRGDEDREGYISKKSNIQSIFPFRQNIWSEDVIRKVLHNDNIDQVAQLYKEFLSGDKLETVSGYVGELVSFKFSQQEKMNTLLDIDIEAFNEVVFGFLKSTSYPLATMETYPLLTNTDVLIRDDIFNVLEESGVGIPKYYSKLDYEVNGETGQYARSRSGCFFCFFQQKIEWVWLYEQHPDLFNKAMDYEKEGYSWMENESLKEFSQPERLNQVKSDHLMRVKLGQKNKKSPYLVDILEDAEGEGCAACFI